MSVTGRKNYSKGTQCSIEDCLKPVKAKGLCNPHYQRLRLGRPVEDKMRPKQYNSLQHCFEFNTETTDHGLIWTGTLSNGYGVMSVGVVSVGGRRAKGIMAHRYSWELVNGPIAEGLELDHEPTCPKNCVTVSHLTPLTKSEHAKLGWKRGEFEGNGWLREARLKRTKQGICLVCGEPYTRDIKAKYCSVVCNTKASNSRRKPGANNAARDRRTRNK